MQPHATGIRKNGPRLAGGWLQSRTKLSINSIAQSLIINMYPKHNPMHSHSFMFSSLEPKRKMLEQRTRGLTYWLEPCAHSQLLRIRRTSQPAVFPFVSKSETAVATYRPSTLAALFLLCAGTDSLLVVLSLYIHQWLIWPRRSPKRLHEPRSKLRRTFGIPSASSRCFEHYHVTRFD